MKRIAAFACVFLALAGLLLPLPSGGPAQARATRPSKDVLTASNMADLHGLIRPKKGEYKWDAIPWYASIWHARRTAAAQDKPIFVFGTGGAGFNDPLGNC